VTIPNVMHSTITRSSQPQCFFMADAVITRDSTFGSVLWESKICF